MKVTLINPPAPGGSDIKSNFVAREDEKKDDKKNVINSEHIVFVKGSTLTTDRKTANYILKQWGFIQEAPQAVSEAVTEALDVVEAVTTPEVEEAPVIEEKEEEITPEDEFKSLKAKMKKDGGYLSKGFKNDKKRYSELKKELEL